MKIEELLARPGRAGAVSDAAPVRGGAVRVPGRVPPRSGSSTASRGWSASSTSPSSGLLPRRRDRAAAAGARVDLHRRAEPAHVRVVDLLPDPDRGDRRLRGGVGVLRRRLQGVDPGQPQAGGHRRRRGQPAAVARAGWTTPSTSGSAPTRRGSARPQDKPRVERAVQYVRGNFWAGETFTDLADAQARVEAWCRERAGMRVHGTTAAASGRDVHRARGQLSAAGAGALRPADLHPGQGAPRLPRRGRARRCTRCPSI